MSDIEILTVGKLYRPDKTAWPEAYEYNYTTSGHRLRLFVRGLNRAEIEGVRSGEARFALSIIDPVIFLQFHFAGAFEWSDCPYTSHLNPPEVRAQPPLDFAPNIGAALSIVLVEAENGIVKALRLLTFSHRFTLKLHEAIIRQSGQPFEPDTYDRQLQAIYAKYSSRDLLRQAVAKCTAGVIEPGERPN